MFQLVNVSSPLSTAVLQEFRQKHMPHITRNITVTALFKTKAFFYNASVLFRIVVAYYELLLNIMCEQTEAALVYDGVQIFVNAFKALLVAQYIQVSSLSCNSPSPWQYGESLLNYMKLVSTPKTVIINMALTTTTTVRSFSISHF